MKKVYRIDDCRTDEQLEESLDPSGGRAEPVLNMRLTELFELTDWTDDDLDIITGLCCGESWTTADGYKITRQDS